jgi:hypothetical protein
VWQGVGGRGGGSVKVIAQNLDLDGTISADGATPHADYGAGAGAVNFAICWINCVLLMLLQNATLMHHVSIVNEHEHSSHERTIVFPFPSLK